LSFAAIPGRSLSTGVVNARNRPLSRLSGREKDKAARISCPRRSFPASHSVDVLSFERLPAYAGRLLRLTLPAALLAFSYISPAAEPDPAAGQRKTVTCNGCHAQAGMKNVPSLGGQNAAYIFAAMQAYQDGLRPHATMRDVAKSYTTQELRNFAAYYAQTGAAPPVEGGQAPASAERCASCHGASGSTTLRADVPRLAGQKAAYIELALKDYRSGARKHAIMQQQAQDLTEADITELAAYYAAREGLFVNRSFQTHRKRKGGG